MSFRVRPPNIKGYELGRIQFGMTSSWYTYRWDSYHFATYGNIFLSTLSFLIYPVLVVVLWTTGLIFFIIIQSPFVLVLVLVLFEWNSRIYRWRSIISYILLRLSFMFHRLRDKITFVLDLFSLGPLFCRYRDKIISIHWAHLRCSWLWLNRNT